MAKELQVKEFSALPVADDGKTLLYADGEVKQSSKNLSEMLTDEVNNKLDTTAFSTVSGSFLTAHQVIPSGKWENVSDVVIANSATWETETDWTDDINAASAFAYEQAVAQIPDPFDPTFLSGEIDKKLDKTFSSNFYPMNENPSGYLTEHQDLSNYYTKSETSGASEISVALVTKQDTLKFAGENNTITSINNSAVGGGAGGAYVPLSATDCEIGSKNTAYSNSLAQGTENHANVTALGQGSYNYADYYALAQGYYNSANERALAQGYQNTAYKSLSQGEYNSAREYSLAQGYQNTADTQSLAQGSNNKVYTASLAVGNGESAFARSIALGQDNSAHTNSFTLGSNNSAYKSSYAQGYNNSATEFAMCQGSDNSATECSFIQGTANKAEVNSMAQGIRNSAASNSLAQGYYNSANQYSLAQGSTNYSYYKSVCFGENNSAYTNSFALGNNNCSDTNSFVHGSYASAAYNSVAIGGKWGWVLSAMNYSFNFGAFNLAENYSQTFGFGLKATSCASAEGYDGDEITYGSFVIGKFNKTSAAPFVIGNGTQDSKRSDLFVVDKDGNVSAQGQIYAGGGVLGAALDTLELAPDNETIEFVTSSHNVVNGEGEPEEYTVIKIKSTILNKINELYDLVSSNSGTWGSQQ